MSEVTFIVEEKWMLRLSTPPLVFWDIDFFHRLAFENRSSGNSFCWFQVIFHWSFKWLHGSLILSGLGGQKCLLLLERLGMLLARVCLKCHYNNEPNASEELGAVMEKGGQIQ